LILRTALWAGFHIGKRCRADIRLPSTG
jgi:hypothetical protein